MIATEEMALVGDRVAIGAEREGIDVRTVVAPLIIAVVRGGIAVGAEVDHTIEREAGEAGRGAALVAAAGTEG